MASIMAYRGLRIYAGLAFLFVVLFAILPANATTCGGQVPSFCSNFLASSGSRTTYFDGPIAGFTRRADAEVEAQIQAIRNSVFCQNCQVALIQFVCEFNYPACSAGGAPFSPRFPCQSSCLTIVDNACGVETLKVGGVAINNFWQTAFINSHKSIMSSIGFPTGTSTSVAVGSCGPIFTQLGSSYSAQTCVTVNPILNERNCSFVSANPSDFPFCGAFLGESSQLTATGFYPPIVSISYPIWSLIARNASVFDAKAQERYEDLEFSIYNSASLPAACPSCQLERKRAVCQSMIPRFQNLNAPIQRPCRTSCERSLSTCRVSDVLDAGYQAIFKARGLPLPSDSLLGELNGYCAGPEFADTSCAGVWPMAAPSVCPCAERPNFDPTFDLCGPYVDYKVYSTSAEFFSITEGAIRRYTAAYRNISNPMSERVCKNCWDSFLETLCKATYPKCMDSGGVRTIRNDSCTTMSRGICKMPTFQPVCDGWISGLPVSGSNVEAITARSPCTCGPVATESLTAKCRPHVTYPVPAGWQDVADAAILSQFIDEKLNAFKQVEGLLCENCTASLNKIICEGFFPRCEPENHIVPACPNGCRANLASCALPSLADSFCAQVENEAAALPGIQNAPCFDSSANAFTGTCAYCGRRADTGQCREYVDWDTYSGSLPGLDISKFTNLAEFVLPTINFPNCSLCTAQIRRTMCSVFVLPCSTTIVDKLVRIFVANGATTITTEAALTAVTRPCFSTCQEVLSKCLTTMPPNPKNFFFACDAKLPGLPPNLDLYAKTGECVSHPYPELPGSCPLYTPPTPRAASNINNGGANSGSSGGLSSAATAGIVIVVVVIPIIIAAVFAVMYIRRVWIFKIKTVDLDTIQPDDRDSRVVSLEQADWSKAKKPRVVSNLK